LPRLPGNLPQPVDVAPLAGGDVGRVWRARLPDDRVVVIKATSYDARLEAEGLDVLRAAGGPTPQVLAVDAEVLVMDHVTGPGDAHELGAAVATVHRDVGDRYGWHRDNVIGPLPQRNTPDPVWPKFFADQRLRPYLDDLPVALSARLAGAIDDGRLWDLLDHDAAPSLVHGDLWSGNIVGGRWLIDPAVNRADRELDLAMLTLFGSISDGFASGYQDVWPLDDGWQRRRPALQLYHLLVHVRLFGATYLGGVAARLDTLGW